MLSKRRLSLNMNLAPLRTPKPIPQFLMLRSQSANYGCYALGIECLKVPIK
jgi:hypothetical protein